MKKVKNPLRKRVIKELLGDWRKYLVIAVFLVVMIGFISGMFVANNSMLTSAENKITEYNLEDGCFEVSEALDEETVKALESGEKADIRKYFLDKGRSEADKEVGSNPSRLFSVSSLSDNIHSQEAFRFFLSNFR